MKIELKNIFLLLLVLLFGRNIYAQQIGSWRFHFNYDIAKHLAYSDSKILASTYEALLVYDLTDNSTRELDKTNSLSDIGVSQVAFCKNENTFVIAYNSTNLDLLTDNFELTNIPDIKNKASATSKSINDIFIDDSKAFISTDLGIIVLDIKNQEIDNTYIIGDAGNPIEVYDCTIFNDTVYALTNGQGVKTASTEGVNLLDFSNWKINQNSLPIGSITHIEAYKNSLYVVADNKLYKKENNVWLQIYNESFTSEIVSLKASEKLVCVIKRDSLGVSLDDIFLAISETKTDTIINKNSLKPYTGIYTNENDLYIGDLGWGLINYFENDKLSPGGKPFKSSVFAMSSTYEKVLVSPGALASGVKALYNYDGFYYFKDNKWTNVNRYNTDGLTDVVNIIDLKENSINNKIYGGTTTGLIEYDFDKVILYDSTNSLLERQVNSGANLYVTGVDNDSKGNVWMVNSHTSEPLKLLTKSGDWFKFPLATGGSDKKYRGIFVDSHDQIWVRSHRYGVAVFPSIEDFNTAFVATLNLNTSTANLPHDNVNAIVEDKNGSIWFGTNEGIAVFDCPEDVFDNSTDCKVARRIKSTLDEYTEYLFDTDRVNAIAVDGANRKWIGTNTGVWLISENGEEIIHSFNTENSPLPSNEINSLAIDAQTGEVFIGTSLGIASYLSDATEPADDISNIKVFPNPIRPEYHGTISVTGLVANSYIKITDLSGTLISDGYALGGKFVWDGKDYNDRRANTGIYLIFSSDNNKKNKAVAKVVFIN